jgi:hypothetical protein
MSGVITPLPNTPPWRSAQLKHRDNFTFTFVSSKMICVPKHNAMKGFTNVNVNSTRSRPRHWIEVSGKIQAPAATLPVGGDQETLPHLR